MLSNQNMNKLINLVTKEGFCFYLSNKVGYHLPIIKLIENWKKSDSWSYLKQLWKLHLLYQNLKNDTSLSACCGEKPYIQSTENQWNGSELMADEGPQWSQQRAVFVKCFGRIVQIRLSRSRCAIGKLCMMFYRFVEVASSECVWKDNLENVRIHSNILRSPMIKMNWSVSRTIYLGSLKAMFPITEYTVLDRIHSMEVTYAAPNWFLTRLKYNNAVELLLQGAFLA